MKYINITSPEFWYKLYGLDKHADRELVLINITDDVDGENSFFTLKIGTVSCMEKNISTNKTVVIEGEDGFFEYMDYYHKLKISELDYFIEKLYYPNPVISIDKCNVNYYNKDINLLDLTDISCEPIGAKIYVNQDDIFSVDNITILVEEIMEKLFNEEFDLILNNFSSYNETMHNYKLMHVNDSKNNYLNLDYLKNYLK